jgi:hypothetical protein
MEEPMKRLPAIALCLMLLLPASALGKNMDGKFGFGLQRTMLGAQGLCVQYWNGPKFAVGLLLGMGFTLDPDNTNATTLHGGVGAKYILVATKYANLTVGGRAVLGWSTAYATQAAESQADAAAGEDSAAREIIQWGLELPLEVEYFFSDAFSLNVATGLTFTMIPDEGPLFPPADVPGARYEKGYKNIGVGVGSLFGQAGFSFYF